MELKSALKAQYHAGLWMLRQCIERCPQEVWVSGVHPRNFWRIAYHVTFYTHLYAHQRASDYTPWAKENSNARVLWETPPVELSYSKTEILEYVDLVDGAIDSFVESLDLESEDCGFSWYSLSKLEHQLLNVRHLQGHVGQLSELLHSHGVDTDWKGTALSSTGK